MYSGYVLLVKLLAFTGLLLATPLQATETHRSDQGPGEKFFAGRVQTIEKSVFLVRLQQPSLVVERYERLGPAAVREDLQLDQELEQKILAEQAAVEKGLKEISSDIEVLYRYKYLMNALAVVAPREYMGEIERFDAVSEVRPTTHFFDPPETVVLENEGTGVDVFNPNKSTDDWYTSVDHIRANYAHAQGMTGEGVRVGVIDSGVDYTHSMLGGPGEPDAYGQIDGINEDPYFPNAKVRGGIDLVGDAYNPRSYEVGVNIPSPNSIPLDRGGHGTHVAGTIAGIGDGQQTYSGVAPDAQLYAMRVFGSGATNDVVVAQAIEYAMDPDFTGDTATRLDVINLSLGGNFGKPQGTYAEVLKNATRAGIVVVAAAGNSGATPFIVGSPSTTDEAIGVAASVDGMDHNWRFPTIDFESLRDGEYWSAQVVEANFTRPVARSQDISGTLVYAGLAIEPFSDELAEKIEGAVAFIERGEVSFADKIQHAYDAGAIGVVIFNNQPGPAIPMGGGDSQIDIPAVMVEQELANMVLERMDLGEEIIMNFGGRETDERPELIDQIAGFSSHGPRLEDAVLKPEVTAPGQQILSAAIASGNGGARLNGTSMSAPHIAGVMALLVQRFPQLTVDELKNILLNSSTLMTKEDGTPHSLTAQGAGLVNVERAVNQKLLVSPAIVSLGYNEVGAEGKTVVEQLSLRSLSDKFRPQDLQAHVEFSGHINVKNINVSWGKNNTLEMNLELNLTVSDTEITPLQAVIQIKEVASDEVLARIPVFGLARFNAQTQISNVDGNTLDITSAADREASLIPFLTMGKDGVKPDLDYFDLPVRSRGCDLREVFARVQNDEESGEEMLQVAVLIDQPVTLWQSCDVSMLFDTNGDGEDNLEWLASTVSTLPGVDELLEDEEITAGSFMLDAEMARSLRYEYERALLQYQQMPPIFRQTMPEPKLDYTSALIEYAQWFAFDHRRLSVAEIPVSTLPKDEDGNIVFDFYVSNNYGGLMGDDRLGESRQEWNIRALREQTAAWPATLEVSPGQSRLEWSFPMSDQLRFLAPLNAPGEEVLELAN